MPNFNRPVRDLRGLESLSRLGNQFADLTLRNDLAERQAQVEANRRANAMRLIKNLGDKINSTTNPVEISTYGNKTINSLEPDNPYLPQVVNAVQRAHNARLEQIGYAKQQEQQQKRDALTKLLSEGIKVETTTIGDKGFNYGISQTKTEKKPLSLEEQQQALNSSGLLQPEEIAKNNIEYAKIQKEAQPKNSTKIQTGKTRTNPDTGAFEKEMTAADPVTMQPIPGANKFWESSNPPQGSEKPDKFPGLSGMQYFNKLPPGTKALVKALGEGRTRIKDVTSYRGNQKIDLAKDVLRVYPTYNQQWIDASYTLTRDATTGNIAKNARSLNTAVGHLAQFDEAAKALKNVDITGYNSLANWIAANTGDPRVLAVNETASALSSELASTFKGGASGAAGTESEIKDWKENFKSNLSQSQFDQAVNTTLKLMKSRLGALQGQFNNNPYRPEGFELISPEAKQILEAYGFNMQESKQEPNYNYSGKELSDDEYDKIPFGTIFIAPDGKKRKKP